MLVPQLQLLVDWLNSVLGGDDYEDETVCGEPSPRPKTPDGTPTGLQPLVRPVVPAAAAAAAETRRAEREEAKRHEIEAEQAAQRREEAEAKQQPRPAASGEGGGKQDSSGDDDVRPAAGGVERQQGHALHPSSLRNSSRAHMSSRGRMMGVDGSPMRPSSPGGGDGPMEGTGEGEQQDEAVRHQAIKPTFALNDAETIALLAHLDTAELFHLVARKKVPPKLVPVLAAVRMWKEQNGCVFVVVTWGVCADMSVVAATHYAVGLQAATAVRGVC